MSKIIVGDEDVIGTISVEATLKKTYTIRIYDHIKNPEKFALEVATERFKDDEELTLAKDVTFVITKKETF